MSEHGAESDAARLTDEQVDELVRLTDAIADEEPYALDELVGTVESWIDARRVTPPAKCPECGHDPHEVIGCTGEPTPSDLWAGVSAAKCDCPGVTPPEATS